MARPALNAAPPTPVEGLSKLPSAPRGFTNAERAAWKRIGRPLIDARVLTASDLAMLGECARASAKLDALYRDPGSKPSTIAAFARLTKEMLNALGASPAARKTLPPTAEPGTDPALAKLIDG